MHSNPWKVMAAYLGLFAGGAVIGHGLASAVAPQSFVAGAVGMFSMPVAFAACLAAWYGVAVLWLLLKLPAILSGRREQLAAQLRSGETIIPGTWSFMPICVGIGAAAGVVIGALANGSMLPGAAAFTVLGLVYGWVMRRLAGAGLLMPPEEL